VQETCENGLTSHVGYNAISGNGSAPKVFFLFFPEFVTIEQVLKTAGAAKKNLLK